MRGPRAGRGDAAFAGIDNVPDHPIYELIPVAAAGKLRAMRRQQLALYVQRGDIAPGA